MNMDRKRYVIYGAGGHARVLKNLLKSADPSCEVLCFFNDSESPREVDGTPVVPYTKTAQPEACLLLGIGSGKVRKSLAEKVSHSMPTIIHPSAFIADDVEIGEGTVVLPQAVIQSGARIGRNVIINSHVCVDHDAVVEDFVTTYPGVYIGGEAKVGEACLLNPNSVVMRFSVVPASMEVMPGEVFHPDFL
jgi:sugar O-acyltransferase (sialic acid O-acetyltransferase NeuD family)